MQSEAAWGFEKVADKAVKQNIEEITNIQTNKLVMHIGYHRHLDRKQQNIDGKYIL
jgi:hypothetical protein